MDHSENPIRDKTYSFAKEIVLLQKRLSLQKEFTISRQLLKSGTSIGANVEEAQKCHSRNDFISKMQIAVKEAYETRYWLRLLGDTGYIPKEARGKYIQYIDEIIKILSVIIARTKQNSSKK